MATIKYRLRSESMYDVIEFIKKTNGLLTEFNLTPLMIPDVEFTFSTTFSIDQIFKILRTIEDSHVMIQTVKPIEFYTGIRDTSIF